MRNGYILALVGLVILTSGCMDGGEETESEGTQAIGVNELSVTPQTIYADSSTTAILHIENTGLLDANLTIDSEWSQDDTHPNYGDRLLTNRCRDIFEVDEFSARGPGDQSKDRYNLPSGTEARFSWSLSTRNANVPIQGLDCNMRFEVPFDYSVSAYRQLQFLESREVQGVSELDSRSSRGPMAINIETIGSTSEQGSSTFVEGDNAEVIIRLRNQVEEGSSYTGFIQAEVPEIEASGVEFEEECEGAQGDTITMYEGESQPIRCSISDEVFEDLNGSARGEVRVSADYTYVKDLGSKNVEVEYRGN
ncbi:MAG: hypothetical protein R6V35_04175 [Candidatus Nanohaloarchaea archaeon]